MTQQSLYSSVPSRLQIQTDLEPSPQNGLFRAGFPFTTKTQQYQLLQTHQSTVSPCTRQFFLGVQENTGFRTNCHPLKPVKIHPVSPLILKVCQKPTFLITSSTLKNHHFDSFALSKIRLSSPLPLFLAIQHPHGSFNKVTLYYFPKSLALDKVRCLSHCIITSRYFFDVQYWEKKGVGFRFQAFIMIDASNSQHVAYDCPPQY